MRGGRGRRHCHGIRMIRGGDPDGDPVDVERTHTCRSRRRQARKPGRASNHEGRRRRRRPRRMRVGNTRTSPPRWPTAPPPRRGSEEAETGPRTTQRRGGWPGGNRERDADGEATTGRSPDGVRPHKPAGRHHGDRRPSMWVSTRALCTRRSASEVATATPTAEGAGSGRKARRSTGEHRVGEGRWCATGPADR